MGYKHWSLYKFLLNIMAGALLFSAISGASPPSPSMIPVMPQQTTDYIYHGAAPLELRDPSVYRWMSGTFRIENKVGNGSIFGSGTLCYYDRSKNIAYIITCGHLFKGGERTMMIDTWYKNGVKLPSPARYTADVIGYDNAEDIAFLKFTPDWIPNEWFPIAPVNTQTPAGTYLWSAGCDGAREVATYKVRVVGSEDGFLITRENSPRHGRSGGGLMTNEGWYVGICVRSSDAEGGTGTGLFVPLNRIHPVAKKMNLDFLLTCGKQNGIIQQIPIVDKIGQQGQYPKDYIPIP